MTTELTIRIGGQPSSFFFFLLAMFERNSRRAKVPADTCGVLDRTRPAPSIDRPPKGIEPDVTVLHLHGVVLMFRFLAHARQYAP